MDGTEYAGRTLLTSTGLVGFFGRVNYLSKTVHSGSGARYDGSSKFPGEPAMGLLPSASIG